MRPTSAQSVRTALQACGHSAPKLALALDGLLELCRYQQAAGATHLPIQEIYACLQVGLTGDSRDTIGT